MDCCHYDLLSDTGDLQVSQFIVRVEPGGHC